jgi:hypothetical protein
MSSPFPGIDPYLEGDVWQEFHETLASAIRAQLMPQLAPRFVALLWCLSLCSLQIRMCLWICTPRYRRVSS